jgi:hypothetical protein
VHAGNRVANRHGAEGIAVIAAAWSDEALFAGLAACLPVLQRHLHRDLDGNRARIGKEHRLQGFRRELDQQAGQFDGRSMRQPAEHDVSHVPELLFDGAIQHRVVVAMNGTPPGGHPVNQLAAIRQPDAHPVCRLHRINRQISAECAVGMPDVCTVRCEPAGNALQIGTIHECGHYR